MSKRNIALLTVFVAVIVDQISKIYIKTHFPLGEVVRVFNLDWFRIHFTENNGMAWGFEFGGKTGKLFLTLFRIVAVGFIIHWLLSIIKKQFHSGVIIAVSLILAGAIGNIIDSVFYGVIFGKSTPMNVATVLPEQSYGELFHGKVVDMLYFPIYEGEKFTFFNAIFNGADSFITTGVALLIIYNKYAFPKENK